LNLENPSIQELGHHVGLPVDVNLQGMVVGGVDFRDEQWVPGKVAGLTEARGQKGRTVDGTWLSIWLDTPIGSGEPRGLLRRAESEDQVWVDDATRVRPSPPSEVPESIIKLARSGKRTQRVQAIKEYRALTGATLDEAQAWLRSV